MAFPPALVTTDGVTLLSKAFLDAYNAEMLSALKDASVQTPAETTTEVRTARGNLASLNARLNLLNDANGNPLSQLSPAMVRNGLVSGNLLWNGEGRLWSRGDAAAPDGWTIAGSGAAVARSGPSIGDLKSVTGTPLTYAMKLTYGAAEASLRQRITSAALAQAIGGVGTTPPATSWGVLSRLVPVDTNGNDVPGYLSDGLLGVSGICHVWCDGASRAYVRSYAGGAIDSPTHPGDSLWHTLITPFAQWDAFGGTTIDFSCQVATAGSAYFHLAAVIISTIGLSPMYIPGRWNVGSYTFPIIATPAAAIGYGYFVPTHPALILGLSAYAATAVPTGGTTLKLDLMTPVGGTFVSMFSALPAFVASDRAMAGACGLESSANYRRQIIRGIYGAGTAIPDNSICRLDVNARDSGNTGAGIVATVHYLVPELPFNYGRAIGDISEA